MAIAIEGTPQTYTDGAAGTGDLSGNFTVTSGMDGVIVCAGNRSGTTHTCTLNGVALQLDLDFAATRHVQIWRMATADMPAPGTYTLAYTTNGDRARAVAFGLSGHDDSGGPELTDTNSGSSTSLSGDLGSAPSSGAMSIMVGHRTASVTFSATDGTIAAQLNEATLSLVSLYSINNQTLAATASATGNWDTATVAYPEAGAGGDVTVDISASTETDSAQSLTATVEAPLGLAAETGAAQSIAATIGSALSFAAETDAALDLSTGSDVTLAVSAATETDSAQSLLASVDTVISGATETSFALGIGAAVGVAVAVATETGSSLGLGASIEATISPASESDAALDIATGGDVVVSVSPAIDVAGAVSAAPVVSAAISAAAESNSALDVAGSVSTTWAISAASDSSSPQPLPSGIVGAIIAALETDTVPSAAPLPTVPRISAGVMIGISIYSVRTTGLSIAMRRL